jgi:hypothetical protein
MDESKTEQQTARCLVNDTDKNDDASAKNTCASVNLLIKFLGDFRYLIFSLSIKSKKKFKDKYDERHCTALVVGKMFQRLLEFH